MRIRAGAALPAVVLASVLLVGGCGDDPAPLEPRAEAAPVLAPAYDGTLEPAAAVLALVPPTVHTLTVTDYDRVRAELGMSAVAQATVADQAGFWEQADAQRPMLTTGMLRGVADRLAGYGFGQVDVDWEAHLFDQDDAAAGWVLAFRDGTDMSGVQKAVDQGVGPLAGASVDAAQRLVSRGTTPDPAQSWAADAATVALVGLPANATYVARGCVAPGAAAAGADVDDLGSYSVQFEGGLVTARLGAGRHDLFTRMRLGAADPAFAQAYAGGVADPETGRIGYVMSDPAKAAALALAHDLPFATCA